MNRRVRVAAILLALTAAALWLFLPNNKARRAVEQTRRSLHQQGFKLDLSEFPVSMPAGLGTNNEVLTLAADTARNVFSARRLDLMRPVNSYSAMVTWKQENPVAGIIDDHFWPDLRKALIERSDSLDRACATLIANPFRFKLMVATNTELMPDVFRARLLASVMAARTVLALHDQQHAAAFTNLLALTRLVTAWQTEPMDISHLTRFRWVTLAQRVMWEALQSKDWTDAELATLQYEWESPNFFSTLPETAAFARASTIAFCNYQRQQPPPRGPTLREFISELVNSPNRAWSDATSGWRNARYRNYESYDDENAWLLYFRDCELDSRRALTANSWSEIRNLLTATNSRPVNSSSYAVDLLRNPGPGSYGGYQRQELPLLARAAEAEARRRLIVTAIAIERFHLANQTYPDALSKLVPDFLKSAPQDFMDGEPLRYDHADDRFRLYSVGIDCVDDHGKLLTPADAGSHPPGPGFGRSEGPDLVWPFAASPEELQAYARSTENRRGGSSFRVMTPEGQPFRRYSIGTEAMRTNRVSVPR